ncbi:MAG: beta-ketoacyl synthase N-terminal-like domain-containing protein, partial [Acidobacteriota bacterium]
GKLDRKALPVPLLERRGDRTAPSTALEASIAEVWRGVLGLDDVGVEESFFDLGGNSLLMVEVHGRLQQTLGARAPSMVELFRLPTIRSRAESLDDAAVAPRLAEVTASTRRSGPVDIAVVGMAARFPGADDLETFWRNLAAGIESVSFYDEETLLAAGVPQATLDNPRYVRARSRIADTDHFDASFFGMSPREAQIVDPQHRMFLETSWSALEDAGYGDTSQPQNVGVWAGAGMPTYLFNVLSNQALAASVGIFQIFLANDKDFLPTRVSYKLNLTGPSLTVQTACSTALVSVSLACDALAAGQCRMALAGGVASKNGGETGYMHETGGISSPDGHTRAFDARGGGTVFGDGVGVVVLKRLDDALADGDHIRAVIRGTALNNDGSAKVGFTAPSIDGQAAVIAQAHAEADVDPRSITYIEAHGTATNLGDPVEVSALTSAFAAHTDETGFCAIGSVKSNFGHLDTAAGAAGLIKTVLALEHKSLPPSLHYETPNPHIDFASSPFFVNTELRDWQPGPDGVRRAGVSSFGMGGTNAHVVLEEAPAATESAATSPGQLLVVSAPTPTALDTITTRLADHLDGLDSLPADADSRRLADVAYTLAVGRRPFNHRRVVVATDTASAVTALRAAAPGRHTDTVRNPVFLFAGQGSQYPGMARDLYAHQPVFREALDGCAEVLERHLGRDLRTVIFADADDASAATTLTDTRFTQPALFAVCWALAELLESWGVVPTAMLGHSLGEWVAATRAGVFDRDDALALVAKRGALMASMQPGSMVSVEATEAELASYLGEELVVAVVNGPRQTVLAGPDEAIDALTEALDADEVQYRRLHTSHAFHSPMMEPMLDEFTAAVAAVERRPPSVPFVSNPSGTWITDDEAVDPQYWARQVREAVRFSDGIATLVEAGHEIFVEIGPGRGLGTLVKQHPSTDRAHQAVATMRRAKSDDADRGVLLAAAGALWTAGVELDWSGVFGIGRKRRPLPTYPFERQRYFVELPRALAAAAGVASRTGAAPATTVSAPTPIAAATSTEYVAPRTDLERDIAALWEEMLGVERVGIHDDYFELGGSSLLAVRLASRLSTQLEREVSPHILLDAPTVAQLATHLEEDGAIETDGATATETTADAPASLLIPLKPGRPEEPPLFMPPPIGGHVFGYRGLAMAMPDEVPVIGIRARGTEPGERSPRSIEAIAREHIAAIRDRQPTGPYRLAGSSLGGMIAWEIAYQLSEMGEEVEFLALLDSPGPGQMPARPADDAEFLHHLYGAALGIEVEELRKLDADAQLAYLVEAARSRGGLPPGFDIDAARRYLELLKD